MKQCGTCKQFKPLSEFYKNGTYFRCKECDKEACKRYYSSNTERVKILERNRGLKYKYGITMQEYQQLLITQDFKCAICGTVNSCYNKGKICNFAVDHNHDTGEVRGLLCHTCNRALGFFKDSIELLDKARRYLNGN